MKFSGFGANAARPSIDGRHASLIGSSELMRKRTVTGLSPRLVNLVEKAASVFCSLHRKINAASLTTIPALIWGLPSVGDLLSTIDQADSGI